MESFAGIFFYSVIYWNTENRKTKAFEKRGVMCVQRKNKGFGSRLRNMLLLLLLLANVSCDQVSKTWARQHIDYHEVIPVIGDRFLLTKIENTGAFLGLGGEWPLFVKWFALKGIPLLILAFGLYVLFLSKRISERMAAGLAFAIGGGIGNLYDRLAYGSVTDFMHLDFGFVRTGIFNMADISITVGILLIFAETLQHRSKRVLVEYE